MGRALDGALVDVVAAVAAAAGVAVGFWFELELEPAPLKEAPPALKSDH